MSALDRVNDFKASSTDEIKELALKENQSCEIMFVDTCAFTNIEDTTTLIATVIDLKIFIFQILT